MASTTHSFGNLGGQHWSRHWTGKREQMLSSLGGCVCSKKWCGIDVWAEA